MRLRISIIALSALCCLLSGCGCSKTKVDDGVPARMKDAAYTNQLTQLHGQRTALAKIEAGIMADIAKLGSDAAKKPEYADLTNRLEKCRADSERIRKETLAIVRARVMKDSDAKGNLKK